MLVVRMKRRRTFTHHSSTSPPSCCGHPCTQTRPLPSAIAPAIGRAAAAAAKYHVTPVGYCPPSKKHRGSAAEETVSQRVGEDCEGRVAGEQGRAAAAAKISEVRRRKYMSKNTLVRISPSLAPKLVLLPQEASIGRAVGYLVSEVCFTGLGYKRNELALKMVRQLCPP